MLSRSFRLCLPVLLLCSHATGATIIDYGVTNLSGGEFRYTYSVYNDGSLNGGGPVQLFDVFFDPSLYQSLSAVTPAPANWSDIILSAVGTVPAEFDSLTLNGGIPEGGTVSGFTVQFTYLGQGMPGSQPFQIADPVSFDVLQSGNTTSASGTVTDSTPEPATGRVLSFLLALSATKLGWKRVFVSPKRLPGVKN